MEREGHAKARRLLIHGGTLVTESGLHETDVLVEGQRIALVEPGLLNWVEADERLDARGDLLMPGAIDLHVHFEEPGPTEREGFWTGTRAAAAGGITLVVEHPLSDPPTTTVERYVAKRDAVKPSAHVDFGLWGGAVPGNVDQFEGMTSAGAPGFKAFMVGSEPDYPALNDEALSAAMAEVARLESSIVVHAEDDAAIASLTERLRAQGRLDPLAWAESRPPATEATAVDRALMLAARAGCRLHLAHLSSALAIQLASKARAKGLRVAVETCPHFLLLDESHLERLGPWAKTAPPLRSRDEQVKLWESIRNGEVDILASDHAPWEPHEKTPGLSSIWDAPNGLQSLQLMTILTLEAWTSRGLPLERFVRLTSGGPARWLGLFPRKGAIQTGSDADIAIYRRVAPREVRAAELLNRQQWTPFEGLQTSFVVRATLLRGRWVYSEGTVATAPFGQFVPLASAARRSGARMEVGSAGH